MDLTNVYNDPIMGKKRKGTSDSPFVKITETLQVVSGKVVLTEIPNRFNRVTVTQGTDSGFYEVENIGLTSTTYSVDYAQGVVSFDSSHSGESFTFSYFGEGGQYFPSSRIWTKTDGNEVTETLQSLVDNGSQKIVDMDAKIADTETARQNTITATNHAYETTSNYETVVESTQKVYKPSVSNYNTILTTYPNPEIGWTVTAQDTHIEYRWDGFSWVNIGTIDSGGFNVMVSQTAPVNVNQIWMETTINTPYITRVVVSTESPSDTSQIWIESSWSGNSSGGSSSEVIDGGTF